MYHLSGHSSRQDHLFSYNVVLNFHDVIHLMISRYNLYQDERRSRTSVLQPRFHLRTSGSVLLFYISPQFPGKFLVVLTTSKQEVHLCFIKLSRGHKEVQCVGGSEKLTGSSPVSALVPSE